MILVLTVRVTESASFIDIYALPLVAAKIALSTFLNPVAFLLLVVMYMNLKYSELFITAQMKCNSSFPVVTKT